MANSAFALNEVGWPIEPEQLKLRYASMQEGDYQ